MKLPHVESAVVPERKITHYLLNPAHPAGGSKARFFLRHGFSPVKWQLLVTAGRQKGSGRNLLAPFGA